MKEIGYFKLTFMRWGSYFLILSIIQVFTDHFWPGHPQPVWITLLGTLFLAVAIPLAYGWHKTRKVFVQEIGQAAAPVDAGR